MICSIFFFKLESYFFKHKFIGNFRFWNNFEKQSCFVWSWTEARVSPALPLSLPAPHEPWRIHRSSGSSEPSLGTTGHKLWEIPLPCDIHGCAAGLPRDRQASKGPMEVRTGVPVPSTVCVIKCSPFIALVTFQLIFFPFLFISVFHIRRLLSDVW